MMAKDKSIGQKIVEHFNPFSDKYKKGGKIYKKGKSPQEKCIKSGGVWAKGACVRTGKDYKGTKKHDTKGEFEKPKKKKAHRGPILGQQMKDISERLHGKKKTT